MNAGSADHPLVTVQLDAGAIQGRLQLSRAFGILVATLGASVLLGWWLRIPIVTTVLPGLVSMKANTALGFVMTGIALALAPWSSRGAAHVARICASITMAMASLTLLEYGRGVDLGIDNLLITGLNYQPPPTRMSLATAVAFVAASLPVLLLSRTPRNSPLIRDIAAMASAIVVIIGTVGLIGYAIDIDVLYSWAAFGTVAMHTAAAFCLLGSGLWLIRTRWRAPRAEEVRIARRASGLIALAACALGIAALVSNANSLKSMLAQGLESTLHARAAQIRTSMTLRANRASVLANRHDLLRWVRLLAADPTRSDLRGAIREEAQSHAAGDVTSIIVMDGAGRELVSIGNPMERDAQGLHATADIPTTLAWNRGIHVRHEVPLDDELGPLGTLVMEQYMPEATRGLLGLAEAFGKSSRLMLCDRQRRGIDCFHVNTTIPAVLLKDTDPLTQPANRAFSGQHGVTSSFAAGRRLTVGYAPIEPFGLVVLLSVDSTEIYRPLGRQLQWVLALVMATSFAGYFLVRTWVRPLAVSLEQRVQARTAQLAKTNGRLALSEQRFRTLFEATPVAMVVTDAAGRIALVNAATEALFGYERSELLGQSIQILVPRDLRAKHETLCREFIREASTRQMGSGQELHGLRKDGSEFVVEIGLSPAQADGGMTVLATIVDQSERLRQSAVLRNVNAALKRSNLELERFAYVASHDLQTPMRGVASFAELLSSKYADKLDTQARDWLRRIIDSIDQLQRLIRDLLEYSRIGAEVQPLERVQLRDVFNQVLGLLESTIRDTGAQVTCGELPTVMGHRSPLVELLLNLIDNAIKYHGPESPRVHVSAERVGGEWQVTVQDNGIGIAPRYHERIFEIFTRLHGPHEFRGTGIGLAACRRIVHRHGGRIWVDSDAGLGSVFRFTLPELSDE
jgi:PAS domain S-box-containing protein